MPLEITVSKMKGVVVIKVVGRVDSISAHELGLAMDTQIDQGKTKLVLDLSGADYLISAGLIKMVAAYKRARSAGGDLRLAALSDRAKEALELGGLDTAFEIYSTPIEAIASF